MTKKLSKKDCPDALLLHKIKLNLETAFVGFSQTSISLFDKSTRSTNFVCFGPTNFHYAGYAILQHKLKSVSHHTLKVKTKIQEPKFPCSHLKF